MGASTLCLGRTHGTHTPETLQSLSHGGSAGTAGHCHCAGTATLGARTFMEQTGQWRRLSVAFLEGAEWSKGGQECG